MPGEGVTAGEGDGAWRGEGCQGEGYRARRRG